MNKRFRFKNSFYSFIGGTVASLACTIIYEAINELGTIQSCTRSYLFEWISGICMCISCVCFLWIASDLSDIDLKYASLSDLKGDRTELWFRAIRVVVEEKIRSLNVEHSVPLLESEVTKRATCLYRKLIALFFIGCTTIILGLAMLVIAKVI